MAEYPKRLVVFGSAYLLAMTVAVGGWAIFEPVSVAGESMRPTLRSGDIVLVRRGAPVAVGDIALVREPGRSAVLHRVVSENGGVLTLKGDANPVDDFNAVASSWVDGPVIAVVPFGGLREHWRAH